MDWCCRLTLKFCEVELAGIILFRCKNGALGVSIDLKGILLGVMKTHKLTRHEHFYYQPLADGYLHSSESVRWGGAIFVVFIQCFIIRQPARAHHSLESLNHTTNFKANIWAAQSIHYLPLFLFALSEYRNYVWYLNIRSFCTYTAHFFTYTVK